MWGCCWAMGRAASATPPPSPPAGSSLSVAVADVNKDGNLTIVVANCYSERGRAAGHMGRAGSAGHTFASGGSGPFSVAVADVNKDGNLDLVVANSSSHNVGLLLGNGPPVVSLSTPNSFLFDIREAGAGRASSCKGPANAFDGYSRLQVGGSNSSPTLAHGQGQTFLFDGGRTVVTPCKPWPGLTSTARSLYRYPCPLPSAGRGGGFRPDCRCLRENLTGSPITTRVHDRRQLRLRCGHDRLRHLRRRHDRKSTTSGSARMMPTAAARRPSFTTFTGLAG